MVPDLFDTTAMPTAAFEPKRLFPMTVNPGPWFEPRREAISVRNWAPVEREHVHFAGRRRLARSVPTMIFPVKPPS